ncbi:MAG: hypothetical protein KatS3mg124_1526 [Porticoccaceae bacterium]|nr:MAG: hypothetical protein KatS3mg124_1526 [Porticoccaceae bacterium]
MPACALVAVTALCYSGVLAFLGVHAAERGLTAAAGYFYLVYAGVLLLTRPPVGKLLDRRGPDPVFYPCLLFLALGLASLGFAREGWQLLAAAAAVALGFGNLMSAAQALAVRVVPRERVALATATFFIFLDTGLGFGPWLLGLLVPSVGYGGLYLLLSAVPLAALVLYRPPAPPLARPVGAPPARLGGGEMHPSLARALGGVEGAVGGAQHPLDGGDPGRIGAGGHPGGHAAGVAEGATTRRHGGEQALRSGNGHLCVGVAQQQGKLVATQAGRAIFRTGPFGQNRRQGAQQPIPRLVARAVVDRLEVVEVEEGEGAGLAPRGEGLPGPPPGPRGGRGDWQVR